MASTAPFVSTEAEISGCRYCPMPVLRALAEGLSACVDLVPLRGLPDEVAALAAGRLTYTLRRGLLLHRDQSRLADPVLTFAHPVHAEHRCRRTP